MMIFREVKKNTQGTMFVTIPKNKGIEEGYYVALFKVDFEKTVQRIKNLGFNEEGEREDETKN